MKSVMVTIAASLAMLLTTGADAKVNVTVIKKCARGHVVNGKFKKTEAFTEANCRRPRQRVAYCVHHLDDTRILHSGDCRKPSNTGLWQAARRQVNTKAQRKASVASPGIKRMRAATRRY